MGNKTRLKIGEFSRLMQVTVKTLRHYEQKELLIPNEVDEWTGYRYYSIGQMLKLNSIRNLQRLGFSLEEIRDLYDEESHTPSVEQLTEKIEETERQLQQLILRRNQLLEWMGSRKKINEMEKFTIESLPEIIVASHREVISDYAALGQLCVEKYQSPKPLPTWKNKVTSLPDLSVLPILMRMESAGPRTMAAGNSDSY